MPWEVGSTPEFDEWFGDLDLEDQDRFAAAREILAERGPSLGRPLVDRVKGSRYHKMKELRAPSTGESEIRALFAFDPDRKAVLLLGGDKAGRWQEWYDVNVPKADVLYTRHLERLEEERPKQPTRPAAKKGRKRRREK